MAFRMKGFPFDVDNTPVYSMDLEDGVMGIADENGSILINKNITNKEEQQDVINHEKVHLDQMKRGDLSYDDESVTWRGKKYPRNGPKSFDEGDKTLPWEKEAYNA
tara:strand:+ start:828 stop:1145 length:318 start_codon:yes stop_codon:yes gene_type:complete